MSPTTVAAGQWNSLSSSSSEVSPSDKEASHHYHNQSSGLIEFECDLIYDLLEEEEELQDNIPTHCNAGFLYASLSSWDVIHATTASHRRNTAYLSLPKKYILYEVFRI